MERLRIHHGDEHTDVMSADQGGFSRLQFDHVKNDAGALTFELKAITIGQLNEWIDEASIVEYFFDDELLGVYEVDSYTPRWGALTATVNCVGRFAAAKDKPFSGTYVDPSAALHDLVVAGGWGWSAEKVDIPQIPVDLEYNDRNVCEAIQELAETIGITFALDVEGDFTCHPDHMNVDETLTLGREAVEFETTYTKADIVNRLTLVADNGTWVYDDAVSQATYGLRSLKVQATGIGSYATGLLWATAVFGVWARPQLQMSVDALHNSDRRPGDVIEILGVGDGRTYLEPIVQITWATGDLYDHLQIGTRAPSIKPPELRQIDSRSPETTSKVPTSLSLEPDEQDPHTLVATLSTDKAAPFFGEPTIRISVAQPPAPEEYDIRTSERTVDVPEEGTAVAYRAAYAGDSIHEGAESSEIVITNQGAVTEKDQTTLSVAVDEEDPHTLVATLQASVAQFIGDPTIEWQRVPNVEEPEAIVHLDTHEITPPAAGQTETWRATFKGDSIHEGALGEITIDSDGNVSGGGGGGGGLRTGTVIAVNTGTVDIDTGTTVLTGVPHLQSYEPVEGDIIVFAEVES